MSYYLMSHKVRGLIHVPADKVDEFEAAGYTVLEFIETPADPQPEPEKPAAKSKAPAKRSKKKAARK